MYRLIYIVLVAVSVAACQADRDGAPYRFIFEEGKAIGVRIQSAALPSTDIDSVRHHLSIVAVCDECVDQPMLGEITIDGDEIVFTPAVPFTLPLYRARYAGHALLDMQLSSERVPTTPSLLHVYPDCDTVPSNLLKVYLQFSEPMMEDRSSSFVHLIDDINGDTVHGAFLDLKPELWDESGTVLTLWIDPGRIKSDLIPNRELGVVLRDRSRYRLIVSPDWRSKNGIALDGGYVRTFATGERDTQKPDPSRWTFRLPDGSDEPLAIDTHDTLDWALALAAIYLTKDGEILPSKIEAGGCRGELRLVKTGGWVPGSYRVHVQARLEDLAGNNLDRLFETDVTSNREKKESSAGFVYPFDLPRLDIGH